MKIIKSHLFFYFLYIFLVLILSYSATLHHFLVTPSGRIYSGVHFYSDDYATYLSLIKQGQDGRFTYQNRFTSEPHQGVFLHLDYLLLGKIGNLVNLNPIYTFHFSRIFYTLLYLALLILFLRQIAPPGLIKIVLLICLFSVSLPAFKSDPANWLTIFLPLYPEPNPLTRFASQPHFLLAACFALLTFNLHLNTPQTKFKKILILIFYLPLSALTAIADPAQTIITLSTVFLFLTGRSLYCIFTKAKIPYFNWILLFLSLITIAPCFLYLRSIRNLEPWKTIAVYDYLQTFPNTFSEFFLSFGPAIILAFIGLLYLFKNHSSKPQVYLPLFWFFTVFVFIFYLSVPLGVNRLRFFHTPIFISVGFYASYGLLALARIFAHFTRFFSIKYFTFILTLLFLTISLPVTIALYYHRFFEYQKDTYIYPPLTRITAFNFLEKNTLRDDPVLCLYEACNQIPYFAGNTVYLGNVTETLNEKGKSALTREIFTGKYSTAELKKILKDIKVKYLFVGYQELSFGFDIKKYPFLIAAYRNPEVTIYQVPN